VSARLKLVATSCVALLATWAFALDGSSAKASEADAEASEPAAAGPLVSEVSRGPVALSVELLPRAPRIGDLLTLDIGVTSEAGVEVLMPEFGEALGRFQIVDFVPSETIDADGRTVARQRYRLQTPASGPQRVPPIAVEFVDRRPGERPAPEGTDAYELLSEVLEFEVESGLAEGASLELLAAKDPLEPRSRGGAWWLGLLAVLGLGAAAAPFAWRAYVAQRARKAMRSAFDVARAELDLLLARGRPQAGEMDPFFVELSAIVRRYLEARFQLRSPEQTTEEFLESMSASPDLVPEHQALLRDFMRRADLVKFAHHVPDAQGVEDSIAAVERFLEESRESDLEEPSARPEVVAHA